MESAIKEFIDKYKNIRPVSTEIQLRPNIAIRKGTFIVLMHPEDFDEYIKHKQQ
jgi:hypothetical protein